MKGAGYLAHNYKAYSLARKDTQVKLALPVGDLPLWHSTMFLNKRCNTYFSPNLVRLGILTRSQLFDDNLELHSHALKYITHTRLPLY